MPPPKKTRDLARSLVASEAMQLRPPCKPNLQQCASMRGCAGNSAHPWELTVFRRSLLVLWLWPSRNLHASARCRLRPNGGLRGLGEVESQTDADEDGEVESF